MTSPSTRSALAGLSLLAPSLLLLGSALLSHGLGAPSGVSGERALAEWNQNGLFASLSPAVLLGGALLALAMNAVAMLQIEATVESGALVGSARFSPQFANAAVILMSLVVLTTLLSYALAENWACMSGGAPVC
jgi:hypothetical protein